MSFQEQIANTTDCGYFKGQIPVKYQYTLGEAGDKFFRTLMEKGEILASRCPECGKMYVFPSIFCESGDCFTRTTEYQPVGPEGEVYSFTVSHVGMDGVRHSTPQAYGLVKFEGCEGGIIHRLNVDEKDLKIGLKVKPVLKDAGKREGNLDDILHFQTV